MRKNKGITLISLVVTIIVLIILAGVAINLTIGENGLLKRAQFAKDEYNNAVESEEEQLNELYAYLNGDELPENTPENPQDAGKIVKLPENWQTVTPNYFSIDNESIATTSTKVASVYAVATGSGETVPIPIGFYYVGGTIDSGVVISDEKADQNKYAGVEDVPSGIVLVKENETDTEGTIRYELVGNQFVWVPVKNIEDYTTYEWSSYRTCYSETDVKDVEKISIKKYGGFYVGRFEAGLASTIEEERSSIKHDQTYTKYNVQGTPQVKPGVIPWMFIDYTTAKANAKNLYNNKTNVESGLLTGAMWDTMITWMTGSSTSIELTTNSSWGNYKVNSLTYEAGRTATGTRSSDWYLGAFSGYTDKDNIIYTSGTTTKYETSTDGGTLLTTGASKDAKKKNIYDVTGNIWEWTEEKAYYRSIETTEWLTSREYRVYRGGGFLEDFSKNPVCYRNYKEENSTSLNLGFRIALYMN